MEKTIKSTRKYVYVYIDTNPLYTRGWSYNQHFSDDDKLNQFKNVLLQL